MEIVNPEVEEYLRGLASRFDEPVLLEMEEEGETRGFPIVGRLVGRLLEVAARAIGARRVFEMGSGFGYSAYWFARAVGAGGEVVLTDGERANRDRALDYLGRAGFGDRVRFIVGDAIEALRADGSGEFDVIFNDIDKHDYPRAWETARERLRVGGVYICDNTLGAGGSDPVTMSDERYEGWAKAIDEHNRAVYADERYVATLMPIRSGDLIALRIA